MIGWRRSRLWGGWLLACAECKLAALLQQPSRKRNRRQDVYDLWLLLATQAALSAEEPGKVHEFFVNSCALKGIVPSIDSMEAAEVVSMARQGYSERAADVEGELPLFDDAMGRVVALYRSLPWSG